MFTTSTNKQKTNENSKLKQALNEYNSFITFMEMRKMKSNR